VLDQSNYDIHSQEEDTNQGEGVYRHFVGCLYCGWFELFHYLMFFSEKNQIIMIMIDRLSWIKEKGRIEKKVL
jgi:hypothetical protein